MGRIRRSFQLFGETRAVVRRDPTLMLFPLVSAAAAIVGTLVLAAPLGLAAYASGSTAVQVVALALIGYASTTLAAYFEVALLACAMRSLDGEDSTLSDGFRVANARLGRILSWSAVATGVGLLLQLVESVTPSVLVRVLESVLGLLWAVATFFAVPVIAFEDVGPRQAIRRSVELVRRTWGESLAGGLTLGVVSFLLILPGALGLVVGVALAISGALVIGVMLALAALLWGVAAGVYVSTLGSVYRAAVYRYATTGQVPSGFSTELVADAFRPRRGARR